MAADRIQQELSEMSREAPAGCTAGPTGNNPFHWTATIKGPSGSPYEGGVFVLTIAFPSDYPNSPPEIKFVTRIYHANVTLAGDIQMDILGSDWSSDMTVATLLQEICGLMSEPDKKKAVLSGAGCMFITNRRNYETSARDWTKLYAV